MLLPVVHTCKYIQVQPHMKKCFDNIKFLDLARMRDRFDATYMNSADGEKVEFRGAIRLDGAVEVCLSVSDLSQPLILTCTCMCACVFFSGVDV